MMEADDIVSVYRVTDPHQAEIIRGALQGEGITCELGGQNQAGFTGVWEIEILVRADDASRAREVIESHR